MADLESLQNKLIRLKMESDLQQKTLTNLRNQCIDLGLDPDNLESELARLQEEKSTLEQRLQEQIDLLQEQFAKYGIS